MAVIHSISVALFTLSLVLIRLLKMLHGAVIIALRDMSQAAFAALFLTNATAARTGVRRTPTAAGAVSSSVAVVLTTTGKGLS